MKTQGNYNPREWMAKFMDGCHEMALDHLRPLLQKMFENCNVALLEFSEKAQSSASQIRFMEAGTVIQNNRGNVEAVFFRELQQDFTNFKRHSLQGETNGLVDVSHTGCHEEQLTLVSKEDTDIQVAIQNMVASANLGSVHVLTAIRQRLTVLNHGQKFQQKKIPAGPDALASAFHRAAEELLLEHETKLIVYLLFDKFVLSKTRPLYEEYNERLLKAGLLPNLRYEARKNPNPPQPRYPADQQAQQNTDDSPPFTENPNAGYPSAGYPAAGHPAIGNPAAGSPATGNPTAGNPTAGSPATGNPAAGNPVAGSPAAGNTATGNSTTGDPAADNSAAGSGQSLGDELFDSILTLLSRRHPNSEAAPANPLPQTELVSAINRVQQGIDHNEVLNPAAVTSTDPVASKQAVANMVANLSAEREQLFRGIDRRRMPAADTQVIDLVGMMFEYMLNDDEIPYVAKAELSRLHTPYLKVAIMDRTFFTDNEHTANKLLNELVRAATRWVFEENTDRGIFPCMHMIVTRVLRDFRDDLEIFTELLDMLHASLHDLDTKATAIEERSRQAADGKEKLELARRCAASTINEIAGTYTIPAAIQQMLEDVWCDKLMFIYLREPDADQSGSWILATQVIEAILWSVEPRATAEEQERLQEQRTYVYNQIKQSIETLSAYGAGDVAAELALIREYTDAAINAPDLSEEPVSEEEDTAIESRSDDKVSDDGECSEPVPSVVQQVMDVQDDSPAPVESHRDTAPLTEVSDPAGEPSEDAGDAAELALEIRTAMAELEAVSFGTWFSISKDATLAPVHAKLSWYSKISENYMFVDSMGIKVAVFKQHELASLLVSGQVEIMVEEPRPLVRRAMEAIRRILGGE